MKYGDMLKLSLFMDSILLKLKKNLSFISTIERFRQHLRLFCSISSNPTNMQEANRTLRLLNFEEKRTLAE
jgi:hypothetical protein